MVSASTEPIADDVEDSDDDVSTIGIDDVSTDIPENSTTPSQQTCFICDNTTNEPLINLYTGQTKYSSTPIYDLVWKFMNNQPSERIQINDVICSNLPGICIECFDQINEYDLAIVSSERLEEQIREKLSQTESQYLENKNAATNQEIQQSQAELEDSETIFQDVESNESNEKDLQDIDSNEENPQNIESKESNEENSQDIDLNEENTQNIESHELNEKESQNTESDEEDLQIIESNEENLQDIESIESKQVETIDLSIDDDDDDDVIEIRIEN